MTLGRFTVSCQVVPEDAQVNELESVDTHELVQDTAVYRSQNCAAVWDTIVKNGTQAQNCIYKRRRSNQNCNTHMDASCGARIELVKSNQGKTDVEAKALVS